MLELRNKTPFAAAILPGLDKTGRDDVTVVVKGTFGLVTRTQVLPIAEAQVPIAYADEWAGEPGVSSIRREADVCPTKPATDVLLLGHAYAPSGRASAVDVSLAVGALQKTVRVFGDRAYYRGVGGWAISSPLEFDRMPLVYERAFGGVDLSDPDPKNHAAERRNPVGTGFAATNRPERVDGLRLPNLETPGELIVEPKDRPRPAGFGVVGRDWLPRLGHAGTYDARWSAERCPFLPHDFDARYFQAAPPDLVASPYLRGGESVHVAGATEGGDLRFLVPVMTIDVAIRMKSVVTRYRPSLDTLAIEPDQRRVVVTWRVTVPCAKSLLYIDFVRVTARAA
jgi:hypothetical protein